MRVSLVTSVLSLAGLGVAAAAPCQPTPETVILDPKRLVDTKWAVQALLGNQAGADQTLRPVLDQFLAQADYWLTQGPWSTTMKTMDVPGGARNDYASQAPYWWPANWNNTSSTEQCPYVQRDGIRNPEVDNYPDRLNGADMMNSTYFLALAWWYTDDPKYRIKATSILKTWFTDQATRMTPNLQHAQIIPCANTGRAIGIIDFSQHITDDLWTQAHRDTFRQWNIDFLNWLTTSAFGQEELAAKNNHAIFAGMQIAALAAWLGNAGLARSTLEDQRSRIATNINGNGTQPLEIVRPTSWHYATFTLVAWTRMVALGDRVGVDMWNYVASNGGSIPAAIKFLLPYATAAMVWPYPELEFKRFAAVDVVHFAADRGLQEAKDAVPKLQPPFHGDVWRLRPAVEQLDSILWDAPT